jgi:hypothetical protein
MMMPGPQKNVGEDFSPPADLEQAIDAVAKRLTRVNDDPQFASRIVASLPERTTWFGWLTHSWAPRLAVLAIAAVASMVLINRQPRSVTPALLPSTSIAVVSSVLPALTPQAVENAVPNRTIPMELLEPLEPLEPAKADHERSLPALDVEALPPMNLPVEASIDLDPLTIVDLPLAGEFPERY